MKGKMTMKTFVKAKVIEDEMRGYGLSACLPSGKEREYVALYVSRDNAERLCDKINRGDVCESHIDDIIEDSLP